MTRQTADHARVSSARDSATTVSPALIPKANASADRSAGSAMTRPARSTHSVTADPAGSAGARLTDATCAAPSGLVQTTGARNRGERTR